MRVNNLNSPRFGSVALRRNLDSGRSRVSASDVRFGLVQSGREPDLILRGTSSKISKDILPFFLAATVLGVLLFFIVSSATVQSRKYRAFENLQMNGTETKGVIWKEIERKSATGAKYFDYEYKFIDNHKIARYGEITFDSGPRTARNSYSALEVGVEPRLGVEIPVTYLKSDPSVHAPYKISDSKLKLPFRVIISNVLSVIAICALLVGLAGMAGGRKRQ